MAFEEVEVELSTAAKAASGVSAGLVKIKGSPAKLRLMIRAQTFAELGFSAEDRFVLLVGRDEDFGMIRLQKNKAGKIRAAYRKFLGASEAYQINLGRRPEFVDRTEKALPCTFEKIDLVTVEIVLPAWASETDPRAKTRIAAKPPAVVAAERDQARRDAELREAEQRRRELELREVAQEAARQTRQLMAAAKEEFRDELGLTGTEKTILEVLVGKQGKTVSRETICALAYGADVDRPDDAIINVMISKIRPKLPVTVQIKTIHGEGFKLLGVVADLFEKERAA